MARACLSVRFAKPIYPAVGLGAMLNSKAGISVSVSHHIKTSRFLGIRPSSRVPNGLTAL